MTHFECRCGNVLFFDNTQCLQCGWQVGYEVALNRMLPIEPDCDYQLCANGQQLGVCNWMVPRNSATQLCRSCSLTRTIPDLGVRGNKDAWGQMEAEKRRLIYSLARVGLSPLSKAESPGGLAFDFLVPMDGKPVLTGHADGVITVNLMEADDAYREQQRRTLREPYRTLIGHFRHEIGHYYWDRFFRGANDKDPTLAEYRMLFGDERIDYQAALKWHYNNGPRPDWSDEHITAYASVHPWEDWAESWAQYLHIVDALETTRALGWDGRSVPMPFTPFSVESLEKNLTGEDVDFLRRLNSWARISPAVNEIGVSLGYRNLYPFVLNAATVRKLCFIHRCISGAKVEGGAQSA